MISGDGSIDRLGALAQELGFSRTLLVADAGLVKAGHLEHARASLEAAGVHAIEFSEFGPNPDADMLQAGRRHAAGQRIDSIIGLGGGSSLDCAKGINFLLTQGGEIHDFQGYGKATRPMLPMIGVPTTAGTGSEAQSYAIISDPRTHRKMACGDPKAAFRAVILDPRLTFTQPPSVTAAAGYDAIAHAVESFVCTKRSRRSQEMSLEAWRLLEANYERVLAAPDDLDARAAMQMGAFYAGTAIELSMLGATHACANPLTARYGTIHGHAIAILLPHVVRWNASAAEGMYAELLRVSTYATHDPHEPQRPTNPTRPTHLLRACRSSRPPAGYRAPLRTRALRQAIFRPSPPKHRNSGRARLTRAPSTPKGPWRFTNARSSTIPCAHRNS